MLRKPLSFFSLLCAVTLLAACTFPGPAPTLPPSTLVPTILIPTIASTQALPTAFPTQALPTSAATQALPTATETSPAATLIPTLTATPSTGGTQPAYLDDSSTATGLIQSYFNAINRFEYLRAYSYWRNPSTTFAQFQQGYADTSSVQLTIGPVGHDEGAGQIYFTVGVALVAQTTNNQTQTFIGCYAMHMSQPVIQGAPPFDPLKIEKANVSQVDNSSNLSDLLPHACDGPDNPQTIPFNPAPTTDHTTVAASNYLDDRSDAVEVLRSLFNAVNRKEYVRAYSYWQTPPAPFAQFQQGYTDTASVQVTFGQVTSDAGAGQLYYSVPVALLAQTTSNQTQTYVGCYNLHLAQPAVQATPPFQPLGIISAKVKQVANGTDTGSMLGQACAQ